MKGKLVRCRNCGVVAVAIKEKYFGRYRVFLMNHSSGKILDDNERPYGGPDQEYPFFYHYDHGYTCCERDPGNNFDFSKRRHLYRNLAEVYKEWDHASKKESNGIKERIESLKMKDIR